MQRQVKKVFKKYRNGKILIQCQTGHDLKTLLDICADENLKWDDGTTIYYHNSKDLIPLLGKIYFTFTPAKRLTFGLAGDFSKNHIQTTLSRFATEYMAAKLRL